MSRSIEQENPRRRQRWMPWLLGALILVAISVAWIGTRPRGPIHDYVTANVVRGDIEDSVPALGSLQPREFVDVGTQVSGQLRRVLVSIGDTVERSGLVAEIDPAVFAAKVEAGKATLLSLKAQLEEKHAQHALATQQYERNAAMFKQDAVSKDALETSLAATRVTAAQVAALRAQQEQTRANLKVDAANLNYTRIFAPMSGTVVALMARQGQTLNANQQAPVILRIADLDTMTVVTQVSEADVVKLASGMNVYFTTLGRPQRRWSGQLRQILPTPETINNVVLYSVLFDVDNTDRELKTQMSAQVFFVLAQAKDVLLVPVAALTARKSSRRTALTDPPTGPEDFPAAVAGRKPEAAASPPAAAAEENPKKSYIVRVLKEGQLEERIVAVGITNRLAAQVLSGLVEGEQVVLNGPSEPARDSKSRDANRHSAKL